MKYINITPLLTTLLYAIAATWITWRSGKEKNPQDYISKHILTIELWIMAIFAIAAMQKMTILIAW